MDGFVEVCINLVGQTEIAVPVSFTTSDQSATGTVKHYVIIRSLVCCENDKSGQIRELIFYVVINKGNIVVNLDDFNYS